MKQKHKLILIIGLTSSLTVFIILILTIILYGRRKSGIGWRDIESPLECEEGDHLIKFEGCEDLTVEEILDAPGEVIGKSSCGALYRATLVNSHSVALLRFLKPTCTLSIKEVVPIVELLGSITHPNLVPLNAFYRGPKGETLMLHPFYAYGNLAQFIKDGNGDAHKWPRIHKISIGIAKGLHHLHSATQTSIIHGNFKSKNVLLDRNYHPYISDFGLHLLLNPTSGQQMFEAYASQGYKAPELIKMKEASKESDVYSFGIVLLELVSGKLAIDDNPSTDQEFDLPSALCSGVLDDRITNLYQSEIFNNLVDDEKVVTEECVLRFFQLAMACCSSSPHLRPNINQIIEKLQEIG